MFISKTLRDIWWFSRQNPENHNRKAYLRIGQDFFNYFDCHKVTGTDRIILDKIHSLDGNAALELINQITDFNQ